MQSYRMQRSYIIGNAVVLLLPLALSVLSVLEGIDSISMNEVLGLAMFWVMGGCIAALPIGAKLEVGSDYVATYFYGVRTNIVRIANVREVYYGPLLRGGLGVGNGLKIWEYSPDGGRRYFGVGEKAYGKEAIEAVGAALRSVNPKLTY